MNELKKILQQDKASLEKMSDEEFQGWKNNISETFLGLLDMIQGAPKKEEPQSGEEARAAINNDVIAEDDTGEEN